MCQIHKDPEAEGNDPSADGGSRQVLRIARFIDAEAAQCPFASHIDGQSDGDHPGKCVGKVDLSPERTVLKIDKEIGRLLWKTGNITRKNDPRLITVAMPMIFPCLEY